MKRRRRSRAGGADRCVRGPRAVCRDGEGSDVRECPHEPVIGEPVGSHEPAGSLGQRRRLHVRHLRGRRGEAHGGAVESELAGTEPFDGGRLGASATDHRRVPGRERGLGDRDNGGQREAELLEAALDDPSGDKTRPVERQGFTPRRLGPTQTCGDLRSDLSGVAVERRDAAQHEIDATEPCDDGSEGVGCRPRVRSGEHPIAQQDGARRPQRHRLAERILRAGWSHRQRPHFVGEVQSRLQRVEVGRVRDRRRCLSVDGAVGTHPDRRSPEIGHLLDQHDRPHVGLLVTPVAPPTHRIRPPCSRLG